ncbi:MAG TPA: HD domain-containing protein [archaeon]|nr:HD domain-containing protein [archaeon]
MKNEDGLKDLIQIVAIHHPNSNTALIEEAFATSLKWHDGQKRKSGEPYFTHPLAVAKMLAENGMDEVIVSAALLHDTVEDTKISPQEIKNKFGQQIFSLVEGLTKLDKQAFESRMDHNYANLIKTMLASSKDIRVLIIKMHDKLHNMRTINYLEKERQKSIAADALTVYVPLAHKLGMHSLKYELEDICFKILEPEKFSEISKKTQKAREEKSNEIKKATEMLKKAYPKASWEFGQVSKSIYNIYSKMIAQNKQLSQIDDVLIAKIIVQNVHSCYEALGRVHSIFNPIPNKFKDKIAIPEHGISKYLSTQVIGPKKKPIKFYIFSKDMEQTVQMGIMPLLATKISSPVLEQYKKNLGKISGKKITDSEELADMLDLSFHNKAMLIFRENGEILNIPIASTALDFSFYEDEKKAKNSAKAEVNGKIVPLWTKLNSGDRVKIFHSIAPQINLKWESFVNSEKAKREIKKELQKKNLSSQNKLVKFTIEYLDRPGIIAKQTEIMARNGLDMEIMRGSCKSDKSTCYTEYYFRNTNGEKTQNAIKELRSLTETIDLNVDYIV